MELVCRAAAGSHMLQAQGNIDHVKSVPSWWGMAVAAWFTLMILGGGDSAPAPAALALQTLSSATVALMSLWYLRRGFPTWMATAGTALLFASLSLVWLHLVPLPPDLWSGLPHRELIAETYRLSGQSLPWRPLTANPDGSLGAAMAFLPAVASFLAALTLDSRSIAWVGISILCCALLGVAIALAQIGGTFTDIAPIEGQTVVRTASGSFSNRNFFAAQLFSAIPFVAALAVSISERRHVRSWLTAVFALAYMLILLLGLALVGSRGGIILAMVSVFLTFAFVFRLPHAARPGAALFACLAGLFVISQASMVGILRLTQRDPLEDYRATIYAVTRKAVGAFFPAGSGFGSFVETYQLFERPGDILPKYVNHVHNEWLELLLEGGLPALTLMAAFLVLFAVGLFRLARLSLFNASGSYLRAASVATIVLMAHAVVDFGLRTPALLTLFAMCLGLLTLAGSRPDVHMQRPHPRQPVKPEPDPAQRPFVPHGFVFRKTTVKPNDS